jgi:hypothetical protein
MLIFAWVDADEVFVAGSERETNSERHTQHFILCSIMRI